MRIAILSHGASGGGSERVCTLIANSLVEKGYEVFFYAIHSDKREYYIDERVHYVYGDCQGASKSIRFLKRTLMLRRFLKKEHIDAFISFIYDEGLAAYKNKKIKKIFSLRNDPNRIQKNKKKLIESLYTDADKVVFQTEDAKNFFNEAISSHGVVIPNPILDNLPKWDEEDHRKEIIAAGRLSKQKNFPMLLRAFASFSKDHEDYELVICGEGTLLGELKALADELGIADKVKFPGHVEDLHDRMVKSAIYVSSSDFEGLSNSMLEALAIGIPTVCTDCPIGGARAYINDGVNGFLVPVNDSDALSAKLSMMADDENMCKDFSARSQKIKDELSTSAICNRWEEVLKG